MSLKDKLLKLREKITEVVESKELTKVESKTEIEEEDDFEERLLAGTKYFTENTESPAAKSLSNFIQQKYSHQIDLDDKVDEFIDWYYKNMIKEGYTDFGANLRQKKMRNFIEKMAVWYELRYPDYEINRLMPGECQEDISINDVMFNKNRYINDLFDENSEVRELEWNELYNANAFIKTLPNGERNLLSRPNYPCTVLLNSKMYGGDHFHLSKNGIVIESELIECGKSTINNLELEGKHVKEVLKILKMNRVDIPKDSEISEVIESFDKEIYQKEEMLNCVMYRIFERGGNRIGPRRALLFAQEFGRNIDIPMIYGVDRTDPGLRQFINEYIKAGGSKDLICYNGYFTRKNKKEKLDTVSIQCLIRNQRNNDVTKYTPEETELHQRLVNVLAGQITPEKMNSEDVKKLRLQRKLEKSRQGKSN